MLDRLKTLERNIQELQAAKQRIIPSVLQTDFRERWALRYGLFESIQIIIDISCHLATKFNLGNPQNYRECVKLLQQNAFLPTELAKKVHDMIGLRNILVHDYIAIDDAKLYLFLDQVEDMSDFAHVCAPLLERAS
jgi:uncharacterized protein YutE (UPF0331/DUF86 family)